MHLDHINIRAPAELLRKVRDFYCDVLGFSVGFRPEFSQPGHWLYVDGRPLVHLSESDGGREGGGGGHLDHVAFRATDLKDVTGRLQARGLDYRSHYISELKMTQLFFRDPAGTGIEINFLDEAL